MAGRDLMILMHGSATGFARRLAVAATAQATTTVTRRAFATDLTLCGSGNTVSISGTLLTVASTTTTPSGGTVETIHFNPQGISGIDTTTGTMYRAVGVTREVTVTHARGVGFTDTFVNRFHIQATGGGESLANTVDWSSDPQLRAGTFHAPSPAGSP